MAGPRGRNFWYCVLTDARKRTFIGFSYFLNKINLAHFIEIIKEGNFDSSIGVKKVVGAEAPLGPAAATALF